MRPTLIISLDLELHWGVRDVRGLSSYRTHLEGTPAAVEALLDMFSDRSVHATWAYVGLLSASGWSDARALSPTSRPTYEDPQLSPYGLVDGREWQPPERYYFAPNALRRIAATKGQELATHTFSHYYCLETGQQPEQFRADIRAAKAVAAAVGHEVESIVFPRNQCTPLALAICAEEGIRFFRGNPDIRIHAPRASQHLWDRGLRLVDTYLPLISSNWLMFIPTDAGGLLNLPASRFLRPASRNAALQDLQVRRVAREMEVAAREGRCYHLWWHPHNFGADLQANATQLGRILESFDTLRRRHGMRSMTLAELGREVVSS